MRKGFTLVEMLAVLAILAILALLIVPIIGRQMNDAREDLYNKQIETIKQGAMNWGADHVDNLPEIDGEVSTLTLKTLKNGGYVSKKLKNPKTKKDFSDTLEIRITFKNNQYYYNIVDDSQVTISDTALAQYKEKIDGVFSPYDKEKRDKLKSELNKLPNESRKYELFDYLNQKMEKTTFGFGQLYELVDHTKWYGIGDLYRKNYSDNYQGADSLLASLNFTGTVDEFLQKYVILVNSVPLSNVESPHNFHMFSSMGINSVDTYLQNTYMSKLGSQGNLLIDSHNCMRLLNIADKTLITLGYVVTDSTTNRGLDIWNNKNFSRWIYLDSTYNRIWVVDETIGDTVQTNLPFNIEESVGYDLKVMFLTSKENILRKVS